MTAEILTDVPAAIDRRAASDRRNKPDRRQKAENVEVERRGGFERRQKVERRRQIDPTTCERDYTEAEIEFMTAIDRYRRENGRPFPTWSEVLEVVRALGYEKIQRPADSSALITGV